ncbi:MAG: nucleotidyltransferase domain-containing protein [Burkholderiales bacterium]
MPINQYDSRSTTADPVVDPKTLAAARLFLDRIQGRFTVGFGVLYGSRARGDHHEHSDADVAVILDGPRERHMAAVLAMSDVAYDILLETGVDISPLPIWREQWLNPEKFSNPYLIENIAREGVRI